MQHSGSRKMVQASVRMAGQRGLGFVQCGLGAIGQQHRVLSSDLMAVGCCPSPPVSSSLHYLSLRSPRWKVECKIGS
eukprot:499566-Hanusia_phi.AAC.2